jgi:signal transduction histidine kinase
MERMCAKRTESGTSTTNLLRRLTYAQALHRSAQSLLQPTTDEQSQLRALTEALEHLRDAAGAGRAALFRNFMDPDAGFCSGMFAGSCAPGIPSSMAAGFAECIPWSIVPTWHVEVQVAGLPVGGPTAKVFAGVPHMRDALLADGILSVQFFPIYVGTEWWGYIGFDDYDSAREWDEEELLLQRTAVAMIGGALRRWQAEAQLQAAHDMAIIQQERQRLARELHDALTQSIYSISLFARAGSDALESDNWGKARSVLQAVEETARQMLIETRLLLFELQPLDLAQGTLQDALEARFNLVERRLGVEADFISLMVPALPRPLWHALLRIALEALNNALKHAAANCVTVQVAADGASLSMVIRDNGKGFDTQLYRPGLGLRTMQERAAAVGGSLTIDSAPGAGSKVIFSLPYLPDYKEI